MLQRLETCFCILMLTVKYDRKRAALKEARKVWIYYYDQKQDITDLFDKNGICQITMTHEGKSHMQLLRQLLYFFCVFYESVSFLLPPNEIVGRTEVQKTPVCIVLYLSSSHSSFNIFLSSARPRDNLIFTLLSLSFRISAISRTA